MQGDGNCENRLLSIREALERTAPLAWRETEVFAVNVDDWEHINVKQSRYRPGVAQRIPGS